MFHVESVTEINCPSEPSVVLSFFIPAAREAGLYNMLNRSHDKGKI